MHYQHLIVDKDGAADWVTLNRPEQLNTLTTESLAELNHYFDSLLTNYAVRVVVLRGAGRAFCAGLAFGPGLTRVVPPSGGAAGSWAAAVPTPAVIVAAHSANAAHRVCFLAIVTPP